MIYFRCLAVILFAAPAVAQGPSADDAKAILAAYQKERGDAAKRYPAEALAGADKAAGQAEKALTAGDAKAAARLGRDARWQLPYTPPGLPEHVVRVLGANRLKHAEQVNGLA